MSSTTASTYHGPEITVESVMRAAEDVRRLAPPSGVKDEIRLRPDDLRELRLRAGDRLVFWDGRLIASRCFGVPVVEDPDAPRLPRKPRAE